MTGRRNVMRTERSATRTFIVALVVAIAAACARNPDPGAGAGEPCAGMRFVSVSNQWSRGIDVYARDRRTATPVLLGTVTPGETREFAFAEGQYVTYEVEGALRLGLPASERSLIRVRYLCR